MTFPSDRIFDRGARSSTGPGFPTHPRAGVPVESSEEAARPHLPSAVSSGVLACDSCVMDTHCWGRSRFCQCLECQDEEFIPHENDETLEAMRREGAHDFLDELYAEVYPVPRGWRA